MSGDNDYLDECMSSIDVDSSIKEFKEAFCSRCYRADCTHSQWGKPGWMERMARQIEAITDPEHIDPNRPDVQPIAQQDFEDTRNLEQDAWSMPTPDQQDEDGKKVHKATPPTNQRSADRVTESAEALGGGSQKDDAPEHFTSAESAEEEKESEDRSEESKNNTEVPDDGIMVSPDGDTSDETPPEEPETQPKEDDWTHPDHSSDDGGLTVNIDDGTKVDD